MPKFVYVIVMAVAGANQPAPIDGAVYLRRDTCEQSIKIYYEKLVNASCEPRVVVRSAPKP